MKKFDKENGSIGRNTKKTVKFPIANQPGSSSENAQNSSKEKKNREGICGGPSDKIFFSLILCTTCLPFLSL